MKIIASILVSAALLAVTAPVSAQTYPIKPIRLIIPFAAGGGADAVARPLAARLSEALGQTVVIDNRGGANGNIGAEEVARATPDGYTLLLANSSLPISVSLYPKLPFNLEKDFTPVALVSISASVLGVNPDLGVNSVADLIALAKKQPGKLGFGSSGHGSTMHLAGELFKSMTKTELQHVPYRGAGPVISDVIAGHMQLVFVNIPPILSNIQAGKIKALAVTTMTRFAVLPDVPTLDESGLKGFESTTWYGILGPAGLPAPIVAKLNAAVADIVKTEDFSKLMTGLGSEPATKSPAEFAAYIADDIKSWGEIVKLVGPAPN
ncbi:MAG: tripartite tricarboxylate transporter substrate binding protein [Pseudolabrys sp.]|nr:tripartite tricarboxylate transporter substrate binding protein [Pseudolabrys sp.]